MNTVRLGIIGMGNIGRFHADYLLNGQGQPRANSPPSATPSPPTWTRYQPLQDLHRTPSDLIRSGAVDAVIIATPHYQHTTLGIAALEAGLHVMVEKPISVAQGRLPSA